MEIPGLFSLKHKFLTTTTTVFGKNKETYNHSTGVFILNCKIFLYVALVCFCIIIFTASSQVNISLFARSHMTCEKIQNIKKSTATKNSKQLSSASKSK